MPLSSPFFHGKVERFLAANGLRMEAMDLYLAVVDEAGEILAGAGLQADVLKCIAVSPEARSEGLAAPLVSRIIREASLRGIRNLKVFTKPENVSIFESLGFHLLAKAPLAVLMENGRGLEEYCAYLRTLRQPGQTGVVVMNANPLTLGHVYLVKQALTWVQHLFVIPVREDISRFAYRERHAMLQGAFGALPQVTVAEGSAYQISSATFPSYFMKNFSDASETQMLLDMDLFVRHIAPALQARVRFVGSEPTDPLTARYNTLLKEKLPGQGVEIIEIPRLALADVFVGASSVREALDRGSYRAAAALTPAVTHPYLLSSLAQRALSLELDTPLKPGLVCPHSNGAHADMDYALMQKALAALRPFWSRMARAASAEELRNLGLDAEKAMLEATGGVNTHRGAIFCLGLALYARGAEMVDNEKDMQIDLGKIAGVIFDNSLLDKDLPTTHGAEAQARYGVEGARGMARSGYAHLFADWLPYYRAFAGAQDDRSEESRLQALLLRIMSALDDTCVIRRVGMERAQEVKREAAEMLRSAQNDKSAQDGPDWKERLKDMCDRYAREGISPGGSADMLALTVFMDSIFK